MSDLSSGDTRLGQGYGLPADLGMVRGVHRQPRLAGGAVVTEHGTLASDNFVAGSTGWSIDGDGNVEFNAGVFRGAITAGAVITGSIVINATGDIHSANYVAATSGWIIKYDGTAEFNSITARGDIIANSFKTATSGKRIEVSAGVSDTFKFFSGDANETLNGLIEVLVLGAGGTRQGNLAMVAPELTAASGTRAQIQLYSRSNDGSVAATAQILASGSIELGSGTITRNLVLFHEDSWHTVSLLNSWANYGSGYQTPRYKMTGGQVEVQGMITGGSSGTVAFNLPSGYRPASHLSFTGTDGVSAGRQLDVLSGGNVTCYPSNALYFSVSCSFTPG